MLYEKQVDENTITYVDFRKKEHAEKGRRFVKKGDNFDLDPNTFTDLMEFKRLRDEVLQLSDPKKDNPGDHKGEASPGNTGQPKELFSKQTTYPQGVQTSAAPTFNLYEFFVALVGEGGIIEIFGDTGTLKSNCCTLVCDDAKKINKSYFYLDTEGKIGLQNKKIVGTNNYKYLPLWDDLVKCCQNMPKKDLLIVDSVGFPISAKTAGMQLNDIGDAYNEMMSLVGDILKTWAYKNNAIVVVVNQPKSDFMKSDEEKARPNPLGDKVHFAPNMILKSEKTIVPGSYNEKAKKVCPPYSIGKFKSHRSTDFMDDVVVFVIEKNNDNIIKTIPVEIERRLKEIS